MPHENPSRPVSGVQRRLARRRPNRLIRAVMIAVVGVLTCLIAATTYAPVAAADPVVVPLQDPDNPDGPGHHKKITDPCQVADDTANVTQTDLPVGRWAAGTETFHVVYGNFSFDQIWDRLDRSGIMQLDTAIGSWEWSTGSDLLQSANRFCIKDKFGGSADQVAAQIGNALKKSGIILVAAIVIGIGLIASLIVRNRRAGWGNVVRKVIILGVLFGMLAGASASTGGGIVRHGKADNGPYQPGLGAPGWWISEIDKAVTIVASLPAKALPMPTLPGNGSGGMLLGCGSYTDTLGEDFEASFDQYDTSATEAIAGPARSVSKLWETSALSSWKIMQFGRDNGYRNYVYCRLLENNSAVPAKDRASIQRQATPELAKKIKSDTVAFSQPTGPDQEDIQLVAWAACRLKGKTVKQQAANFDKQNGWTVNGYTTATNRSGDGLLVNPRVAASADTPDQPGTGAGYPGSGYQPPPPDDPGQTPADQQMVAQACWKFFNQPPSKADDKALAVFDWTGMSSDEIAQNSGGQAADYLLTLHGARNSGGIMLGLIYVLTGLAILIVFGMLALGVIICKVGALLVAMAATGVATWSLFARSRSAGGGDDKLVKLAKTYLGMSAYAYGLQLIIALILFVTKLLVGLAALAPGGADGNLGMAWTGVSVLGSLLGLHFLFKASGVPSPFTPTGALGWGKAMAGGAVGGAIAGGMMASVGQIGGLINRGQGALGRIGSTWGGGNGPVSKDEWGKPGDRDRDGDRDGDGEARSDGSAGRGDGDGSEVRHKATPMPADSDEAAEQIAVSEDRADEQEQQQEQAAGGRGRGSDEAPDASDTAESQAGGKGQPADPNAGSDEAPDASDTAESQAGGKGQPADPNAGSDGQDLPDADRQAGKRGKSAHTIAARSQPMGGNLTAAQRRELADRLRIEAKGGKASLSGRRDTIARKAAGYYRDKATIGLAQFKSRPVDVIKGGAKWAVRRGAVVGAGTAAVMAAPGLAPIAAAGIGMWAGKKALDHRRATAEHRHADKIRQYDQHRKQNTDAVQARLAAGDISAEEADQLRRHPQPPQCRGSNRRDRGPRSSHPTSATGPEHLPGGGGRTARQRRLETTHRRKRELQREARPGCLRWRDP